MKMKKFVFLLIFIPAFAFGQKPAATATAAGKDLKESAEAFVTRFIQCWDDKNWDQIFNSIEETGTYYSAAETTPLPEMAKSTVNYYKYKVTDARTTVNFVSADVYGQNTAMVTVRYLESLKAEGRDRVLDYLDILVLEMKEGNWKISRWYSQCFYPVIVNPAIDEKWQKNVAEPVWRYSGALYQFYNLNCYLIEDNKKNGTSPAQLGKWMGERFAKTWNQSKGFEGLVSGYFWLMQSISPYVEFTERNENIARIKFKFYNPDPEEWNVTENEMLECFRNVLIEIAANMGGTCSIAPDGKFYMMTLQAVPGWLPDKDSKIVKESLARGDTVKADLVKANFLTSQGKTEEASKIFTRIMKIRPHNKEAVQGWLLANMKKSPKGEEDAIKSLEELEKLYPENSGVIFWKSFIEAEYGHNEEALKDCNRLIKIQPDSAINYIGKGQVLYAMERYKEAFKAFDKATSLNPERSDVWGMKGAALARLGRYDEAIASMNRGLKQDPDNPNNIYNRACIYSLKGDKARALADLKTAISLNPEFREYSRKDKDFERLYDDEDFKKLTE